MTKSMAIAFAAGLLSSGASAAQLKVSPAEIIVNPVNQRGYTDLVLHNVGIRADNESFTVQSLVVELLEAGAAVETRHLTGGQMARETGGLFEAPVPQFIDAQLLARDGLTGFFNAATTASPSATVQPGTALVATRLYFATRARPDSARITVKGVGADGRAMTATASVPIRQHKSPFVYRSPLSGTWLMQAIPSLQSHHRLNAPSEFAVDFMKVDDQGRLHRGEPLRADSYYAFAAPVMAAAAGLVVKVIDGAVQDRAAMTRRAGEPPQAAAQRIGQFSMQRMKADFTRAVAGNLVVIRHGEGAAAEYSSYGHLRAGIPVREGQSVRQGEVIGHVGDTGDSPTVHLHFQVNAGPDPFLSASLPVQFADIRAVGGNSDVGRFVIAEPAEGPAATTAR